MIIDRYSKKDNEHDIEYLLRLVDIKMNEKPIDLEWQDIVDLCNLDCHYDSLRKAMQPDIYGAYSISKFFIDKYECMQLENEDDETLKKYREMIIELQKEKQKIRDEKNAYNQFVREQARLELFLERIDEAAEKINNNRQYKFDNIEKVDSTIDKEMVCAFADPHYGADFKIEGFNGDILNEYNPEIFRKRMTQLYHEIISFVKKENCKTIHLVDLGDSIEGILHLSQLKALKTNIVDDIMEYSYFIIDWLQCLAEDSNAIIKFYTSIGNHSDLRLLTGKKGDFPHENLERIYSRLLAVTFETHPNIYINKSTNELNYFDVCGYYFLTAHGNHEKNIPKSISEYEDTYEIEVNYLLLGHLHKKHEIETSKNKEVIVVRSIMGLNEYSTTNKLTSNAGALMFTVEKDYGKKYSNEVKFT